MCNTQGRYHPGGPYYYLGWKAYFDPAEPIDEVSLEQAKTHDAYYVAYFGSDGKIVSFTKILYGQFAGETRYFYRPDGVLERSEDRMPDNEKRTRHYDRWGDITRVVIVPDSDGGSGEQ
jgi:hypothetical protein